MKCLLPSWIPSPFSVASVFFLVAFGTNEDGIDFDIPRQRARSLSIDGFVTTGSGGGISVASTVASDGCCFDIDPQDTLGGGGAFERITNPASEQVPFAARLSSSFFLATSRWIDSELTHLKLGVKAFEVALSAFVENGVGYDDMGRGGAQAGWGEGNFSGRQNIVAARAGNNSESSATPASDGHSVASSVPIIWSIIWQFLPKTAGNDAAQNAALAAVRGR